VACTIKEVVNSTRQFLNKLPNKTKWKLKKSWTKIWF
jgi:hypothetical protein